MCEWQDAAQLRKWKDDVIREVSNSSASSDLCYSDWTLLVCTWCRMLTHGDMQDRRESIALNQEMEDKLRQFARAAIEEHRPTFEMLNLRTKQKKYAKN